MSTDTLKALIALVIFLTGQMGAGIWWASNINNRVATIEVQMKDSVTSDRRLLVIETVLPDLKTLLASIDNRLRRLEEGNRGIR